MPSFYVEIVCRAVSELTEVEFEAAADSVAGELFSLEVGHGARFAATPRTREVTFGFLLDGWTKGDVLRKGSAIARTALHAAGGETPDWTSDFEEIERTAKKESELVGS